MCTLATERYGREARNDALRRFAQNYGTVTYRKCKQFKTF